MTARHLPARGQARPTNGSCYDRKALSFLATTAAPTSICVHHRDAPSWRRWTPLGMPIKRPAPSPPLSQPISKPVGALPKTVPDKDRRTAGRRRRGSVGHRCRTIGLRRRDQGGFLENLGFQCLLGAVNRWDHRRRMRASSPDLDARESAASITKDLARESAVGVTTIRGADRLKRRDFVTAANNFFTGASGAGSGWRRVHRRERR